MLVPTRTLIFFTISLISARKTFATCPYANELHQLFGSNTEEAPKIPRDHYHQHLQETKEKNKNEQQQQKRQHGHLRSQYNRHLQEDSGLLNEGKGCWGHCDFQAGDCTYCGTGQCCRQHDYEFGVSGCELADGVTGAICGNFRGEVEERLRNEGKACWGHCNRQAGDCENYCGTGQCCRQSDALSGVPKCELAITADWENGPGSQCGAFDGLLNEDKGCWGFCDETPGDCNYCGTGQCCRKVDYENGVNGCELAFNTSGAKCGRFRGEPEERLRNAGKACMGHCDSNIGDCDYCGTGQCCRQIDGVQCVPGCELASINWLEGGPGSQCGEFSDPEAECANSSDDSIIIGNPTRSPTTDSNNNPPPTDDEGEELPEPTELLNEGIQCGAENRCNIAGGNPGGDCDWCGTGQCCTDNDWWRGVPGCELAGNIGGTPVCGAFKSPLPDPAEFRLGDPLGTYPTPNSPSDSLIDGLWIKDIDITDWNPSDYDVPEYYGDGGKPWSRFEMALVRDLLLFEMRQASMGRDETGAAKFIRLPFHDCLLYDDGTGGCDGCLNWDHVGFEFEGRVESRNFEDNERTLSNNGLGEVVEFLEYIYTLDFGKTWANGCWKSPAAVSGAAWVADTRFNPITVSSIMECQEHCQNTQDCQYFTVPHLRSLDSTGPCRLFSNQGIVRETGGGRLIAGNAHCASESWSLQSTGKSRADLWAFASLVAVEEGIQRHNWACDGDRRSPHNGPIMCTQFEGEDGCNITLNRPFVFKTGRKDCDTTLEPSYKTEKYEHLPDDHFNGTMTVRFMEKHFQFSAKETVTIMGAHTVGTFHQRQTGHKYVWTSDFQAFNNQFYRNIAGREDWFFDDDECTRVGDAWGNKGHAVWITKMNQVYRTGGPIQWIQKKVVCPNCSDRSYERGGRHPERLAQDRDCCLRDVPEGAQCRPDNYDTSIFTFGSKAVDRDDDFSDGCEYSHFIFGTDEAALGSDMGLVYKFDVDIKGFPSGCPGLATFYPSGNRFSDWTCGIDGRPWFADPTLSWNDTNLERITKNDWTDKGCPVDCGRQDYQYPGDDLTLADHVERYADDQDVWIQEFIPVMEKMIANGYAEDDLVISFNGVIY